MATFKVGDKVRIVGCYLRAVYSNVLGKSGVITEPYTHHEAFPHLKYDWLVVLDDGFLFVGPNEHLAPLTDPKADAFLESIRKLKPLHEEPKVREYDIDGVRWTVTEPDGTYRVNR